MNDKYRFPDENSSEDHWSSFIDAELKPVSPDDIEKLKRVIGLYDKKLQKIQGKNKKKLSKSDKQIAEMKCQAVFHLAHAEARMKRQKKVRELIDKIDIDWAGMTDELNAIMKSKK
tara:strand:+ start:428 stop:775 length:348 start_codon:yes stop_codon:yes gene_type:complete